MMKTIVQLELEIEVYAQKAQIYLEQWPYFLLLLWFVNKLDNLSVSKGMYDSKGICRSYKTENS